MTARERARCAVGDDFRNGTYTEIIEAVTAAIEQFGTAEYNRGAVEALEGLPCGNGFDTHGCVEVCADEDDWCDRCRALQAAREGAK